MTKKEFQKELKNSANVAVQRANKFLEQLDLTLHINWKYKDWDNYNYAIGIYEYDSVIENCDISIGFNINRLYERVVEDIKENPWSNPYTILDETVQTTVFHEMGHGIVQFLDDIIEYWDEDEDLPFYDNNQQFIDNIFDNEEDSVEEFAWSMYDNQLGNSGLYKVIQLYLNWCKHTNLNGANKVGGQNYANMDGNSFYTQEKDNVNEKYIIKEKRQQSLSESLTDKIFEKLILLLNET